MKTTIGKVDLTLQATERDGQWIARAVRDDNGDPFGTECTGATEAEAITRLERWLEWHREHTDALEALQQAERAYHRTIAGSAFSSPIEGPTALEMQKESLDAVEAARVRLDEVRGRRPHP
jgi:hypothetical protein